MVVAHVGVDRGRWRFALAAALALAAMAGWWSSRSRRAPIVVAPAGQTRSADEDSAAAMTIGDAYSAAQRRVRREDYLGSLPYYGRVGGLLATDAWQFHTEHGVALQGAALDPRVRSTWERVSMGCEALAELDRAERLVPDPLNRAVVVSTRAKQLRIWGLPWETLLEFRRAQGLDPTWRDLAESADLYAGLIHRPAGRNEARKER